MKIPPFLILECIRSEPKVLEENRFMDSAQSTFLDAYYAMRFATLLATRFDQWDAFKYGVIDKDGRILVRPADRSRDQRRAFTHFHRLIWNMKRLLDKAAPGRIASILAATRMIMESDASPDAKAVLFEALEEEAIRRNLLSSDDHRALLTERRNLTEEAPVNNTSGIAKPDMPLFRDPLNRRRAPRQVGSLPDLKKREIDGTAGESDDQTGRIRARPRKFPIRPKGQG